MKNKILTLKKIFNLLFCAIMATPYMTQAKNIDLRTLEDFTEIEASNGVHVILQKCAKGENSEAKIETEGLEPKDIITRIKETEDGKQLLFIFIKAKTETIEISGKPKKQKATVYVKYNTLNKIKTRDAASISQEDEQELSSKSMEVIADSASKINLTVSIAEELKLIARAAAKVKLKGKSQKSIIESSSGATVDMSEIEFKDVEITAKSASTVKVFATKKLKIIVSSLAKVVYFGNPSKIEIERGSMGTIKSEA